MQDLITIDKADVDGFRTEGGSAIEKAKTLAREIKDSPTLEAAAQMMLEAKKRIRIIEERFKKPKSDAKKAHQSICDLETELVEPYRRVEYEILKPAIASFTEEQDKKRQQEEERLRAEARKREEEARLQEAQRLEENGEKEMVNAVLSAPIVVAPVVIPKMEQPKGVSYQESWRFEIEDPEKIPCSYHLIDEKKIGAIVRALKNETKIPGIRVWSEKIVRAKTA